MTKNKIYDLKYYNEYQKMRFINKEDNATYKQLCSRLLGRVSRAEEYFDKDLYDFSLPQLEKFFRYLNPSKVSTSRISIQAIYNYIEWAINQDISITTKTNPLNIVMGEDFYRSFIDESKQTIFNEVEIDDIIRACENYQDSVIVQLLFEGASGTGLAELLNLQRKNIDFNNNRLLLTDSDETTRILEVSEKCMKLIAGALDQTMYKKNNGVFESDRGSNESSLVENDFVIKTCIIGRIKSFQIADKNTVHKRLNVLKHPDMLDKPYLTTKNIKYSGMLKIAKDFYLNDKIITKDCTDEIGKRFNITKKNDEYVILPYKRDFLNENTIKKTYSRVDDLLVKETDNP